MNSHDALLEKIYLKPGELVITEQPVMVTTVLGSCIAVTMFHPLTGNAAICHAMQPHHPYGESSDSFKYVDVCIFHMARYFRNLKIPHKEIQVKLFGGSEMFNRIEQRERNVTVGWQNITVANKCLKESGMVVNASDTGGIKGRKLIFTTDSGAVFIKKVSGKEQLSQLK